jgi:hypothetical protein
MNAIDITLAPDIVQYIKECRGKEHSESYLISVMHRVQDRYGSSPTTTCRRSPSCWRCRRQP